MTKVITPKEALKAKLEAIPDFVIEAFNTIIVRNLDAYGRSSFKVHEVVELILNSSSKDNGFSRQEIYTNKWLDIEKIYREQGWKVEYDQPGYNEDYDAYYTFSEKSL